MESLTNFLYGFPKPPPRVRTKPVQVICVGLPRSATESLSIALQRLGMKTYHGWDLCYEENGAYIEQWAKLAERKWNGSPDGDFEITRAEFDALLGHCDAIIDTAASFFAANLVEAYPDAKIILNTRKDLDAWHRSVMNNIVAECEDRWVFYIMRVFNANLWWVWNVYLTHGYPGLFRSPSAGRVRPGVERNGKWVYREHTNMIRGLVPKERLLEWSVEDGWEPVCKFLDKPIPDEPFPRVNGKDGFKESVDGMAMVLVKRSIRNLVITVATVGVLTTAVTLGVRERGIPWGTISWAGGKLMRR